MFDRQLSRSLSFPQGMHNYQITSSIQPDKIFNLFFFVLLETERSYTHIVIFLKKYSSINKRKEKQFFYQYIKLTYTFVDLNLNANNTKQH